MPDYSSRGDLAFALFKALGVEPTSSGKFSDAGYLDDITSTLFDLGITNGVGGGQFGTAQPTTRGQAFTMIARALGLADKNTSIEQASQALVNAGIVKGYNNDPRNLGINDPLEKKHLGLLIDRLKPELTRTGSKERLTEQSQEAREAELVLDNPAYAAYLQQLGVRRGEIKDEMALRTDLFNEDARRRSESYQRAAERAVDGVQTDFENRGLFRSGTRLRREAETRQNIGYQQEQAQYAAQRAYEEAQRSLGLNLNELDREAAMKRVSTQASQAQEQIEEPFRDA